MYSSPWPILDVPQCNILTYLFPPGSKVSKDPLWIDAKDTSNSLSPAQMLLLIQRFALGLDKLGIKEKEAIMVFTPNHIFVPVAYLAAAGSRRYFTGANPAYTASEVAYQMKDINASVVLIHDTLLETGIAAAKQAGIPNSRLFIFSDSKDLPSVTYGLQDWRSILARPEEAASWKWHNLDGDLAMETIAVINFSSGTTGLPKGVAITHHNLVANSAQAIFAQYHAIDTSPSTASPERWLAFLPLYHAYSQLFTINIACKLQVPVYIMSKFTLESFLASIEQFKITSLQAVPPILVMMAKREEISKYDVSSLRYILCGAAPLSSDLQNEISDKFNLVVSQAFGMSETTCAAFMTPGMAKDTRGSIGNLLPNTEARLIGEDEEEILAEDCPGELCLRGPQMMLKYWNNYEATQKTKSSDGWIKTGDVAITRKGKWWIVDRKKELIKVNVS